MKYVLEFGERGGRCAENLILPSKSLAADAAAKVAHVLGIPADNAKARPEGWHTPKISPRCYWQSQTHYVALSRLDGVMRGPASATLWNKP